MSTRSYRQCQLHWPFVPVKCQYGHIKEIAGRMIDCITLKLSGIAASLHGVLLGPLALLHRPLVPLTRASDCFSSSCLQLGSMPRNSGFANVTHQGMLPFMLQNGSIATPVRRLLHKYRRLRTSTQ